MEIVLIAAMGTNRVIGHRNRIPWSIPEEMAHFKETTMGYGVIMGRRTFDSIGTPLKGRFNVVMSRQRPLVIPGCMVVADAREALNVCRHLAKIFVIGGRSVYRQFMEAADTIILSVINREYEGDTFFPDISEDMFRLDSEKEVAAEVPFTIMIYRRRPGG